jgi:hypothetical protein
MPYEDTTKMHVGYQVQVGWDIGGLKRENGRLS